ncbi:hypothetical protein MNBD_ALPHA06-1287, partial [hydrothermal vent metagenome]
MLIIMRTHMACSDSCLIPRRRAGLDPVPILAFCAGANGGKSANALNAKTTWMDTGLRRYDGSGVLGHSITRLSVSKKEAFRLTFSYVAF